MVNLLLVLAALIVLLQIGLMSMVRKLIQQLDHERGRITLLEDQVASGPGEAEAPRADTQGNSNSWMRNPSGSFQLVPEVPQPVASSTAPAPMRQADLTPPPEDFLDTVGEARIPAAQPQAQAAPTQAELRTQMLDLMQQLVGQGMSVREIAARCGLSEAEAELMLSLQGTQR
ncbi:MAG: DUF2802 domain-containing protein [Burkholderiales bacterium]|jgi:hypothetical protein|nr:DUF2802 domain-containing protein [Burkholderiales bacterium]